MKENNPMKKIAEVFHIAPSALRYWDSEELIRFERNENQYRYPTIQTMMDISDVMLFRSLAVPVRVIRRVPAMNTEELGAMLDERRENLENEIERMKGIVERIRLKRRMIRALEELKTAGPQKTRARLPALRAFSFDDERTVQTYVNDPYQCAVVLHPGAGEPLYGIVAPERAGKDALLFEGDREEAAYLRGLLRIDCEDGGRHSADSFARRARELGCGPGTLVGRYLISACEGRRYDYYEAWMRLDG